MPPPFRRRAAQAILPTPLHPASTEAWRLPIVIDGPMLSRWVGFASPARRRKSVLYGAGAVLLRNDAREQLSGHALEKCPVPAIRREGRAEHVVANDPEGLGTVVVTVEPRRATNLVVGGFATPVEALRDDYEHAADDRSRVPGGNRLVSPIDDDVEDTRARRL